MELAWIRLSKTLQELCNTKNKEEAILESGSCWIYRPEKVNSLRNFNAILVVWCMIHDHPLSSFSLVHRFAGESMIDLSRSEDYYVIFRSQALGEQFQTWYTQIDDQNGMLPRLPVAFSNPVYPVSYAIATSNHDVYNFERMIEINDKDIDVFKWLLKNCSKPFYRHGMMLFFESADEAMLFKLAWVDNG